MLKLAKSEELFELLKTRLAAMHLGDRFPSVRQIMKEYNVSQFTVGPALDKLREEGLIECIVGRGTFVSGGGKVRPLKIAALFPQWPSVSISDIAQRTREEVLARSYQPEVIFYDVSKNIYEQLNGIDADALIIDPPDPGNITPDDLQRIIECHRPVVLMRSTIPSNQINYVCGNNQISGMLAANYLHQMGHRRIGVVLSEPRFGTSVDLSESFIHSAGLNNDEVTVIDCKIKPAEDAAALTYLAMKSYLAENTLSVSVLFVVSDETVPPVIRALTEAGISVPGQIGVMGFGNVSNSAFYQPPLTTIDTDRRKMAAAAIEIIEKKLAGESQDGFHVNIYPTVIERESIPCLDVVPSE